MAEDARVGTELGGSRIERPVQFVSLPALDRIGLAPGSEQSL